MDKDCEEKLYRFCFTHPNIFNISKILGEWDYEIQLEASDYYGYRQIIERLKDNLSGTIKWYQPLTLYKLYKFGCFPLNILDIKQ